jgi:AraC-like DNA-binding protein/mannose-6-phosphate isomerase-like protein (cupin superfamily)
MRMEDNQNDNLPVFIRRYGPEAVTKGLHCHQMVQINYVVSGKIGHTINRSQFTVNAGDIFVIPPTVPHGLVQMENHPFSIIELEFVPQFLWGSSEVMQHVESFFDFAYIEPFLVSEKDVRPRLNIPPRDRPVIDEAFAEIFDEYAQRADGFLLAIKACLLRLLVRLGRLHAVQVSLMDTGNLFAIHRDAINRALRYIDTRYTQELTVDEIAQEAILSRSYFSYLFKQINGITCMEYVQEKRIQKACEQLVSNTLPIAQIALAVGFGTVTHFNRVFKACRGNSPRQYRKLYTLQQR